MKVYLASDHAGFELKKTLLNYLSTLDYEIEDLGPFKLDLKDDYPDFIKPTAIKVSEDLDSRAIVIGGSGQGEAIVCNRVNGVRAVVYYGGPEEIIKLSKEHNDANILSLGARFLSEDEAIKAVEIWLKTDFSGDSRHVRRIKKIDS